MKCAGGGIAFIETTWDRFQRAWEINALCASGAVCGLEGIAHQGLRTIPSDHGDGTCAAVEEGIVPGGGVALINGIPAEEPTPAMPPGGGTY